jgi:hypothetical protein
MDGRGCWTDANLLSDADRTKQLFLTRHHWPTTVCLPTALSLSLSLSLSLLQLLFVHARARGQNGNERAAAAAAGGGRAKGFSDTSGIWRYSFNVKAARAG